MKIFKKLSLVAVAGLMFAGQGYSTCDGSKTDSIMFADQLSSLYAQGYNCTFVDTKFQTLDNAEILESAPWMESYFLIDTYSCDKMRSDVPMQAEVSSSPFNLELWQPPLLESFKDTVKSAPLTMTVAAKKLRFVEDFGSRCACEHDNIISFTQSTPATEVALTTNSNAPIFE